MDRVVSQLLTEIDGLSTRKGDILHDIRDLITISNYFIVWFLLLCKSVAV